MAYGGDLQANTAVDLMVGPFVDEDNGKTAETSLTITQAEVRLSKNGANMAQKNEATSLTHDELGNYVCKLNTTDTNAEGILTLMIHESGALPIKMDYTVLSQAAYISKYTAKDTGYIDVNVKTWLDQATAAVSVNGVPEVDLTHIGGLAISGNNATLKLKQFDITNNAGTAMIVKSTGSSGIGLDIAGNGTGVGTKTTGGATSGHGFDAQGGASGGQGINAKANGGNSAGALFVADGSGIGLDARGGADGAGIRGLGGGSSGPGIEGQAQANDDAGMELVKHGTGKDLDAGELLTAGEIENAVWNTVLSAASHNDANSAGKRLRQVEHATVLREEEQAQGGTSSTITLHNDASIIDGFYDDTEVIITGDTGVGQARHIHAYDGGTRVAGITPDWKTDPDNTSDYVILSDSEKHVHEIDTDALSADALASGAVDKIWAKAMQDLAGIPGPTASVLDAINILFMALKNKQTATDAQQTIGNNAGAAIATAVLSDAAGTTTKEEYA